MSQSSILAQEFPNTRERAEYIKRSRQIFKEDLLMGKIDEDGVSEYWYNWVVDFAVWRKAMEKVEPTKQESFPWRHSVPASKPRDPSDVAVWFPKFKADFAALATLSASERMERGLEAIPEQPSLQRTQPNIATIELRQDIWDEVFPDEPCTEGRPFEIGVPKYLDFEQHVCADDANQIKWLPSCVRIDIADRECPEGNVINAIVVSPQENTEDTAWSRLLLGVVYKTVVSWAREVFLTRKSTPLSEALADIDVSSFFKNATLSLSEEMQRLSLEKSLVDECNAQLALAPYKSDSEYVELRIAAWLEAEKSLVAEKRYEILVDWCDKTHVNFESLTQADQRVACFRAWEGKIKEWAQENPIRFVSWTEEQSFATMMLEETGLTSVSSVREMKRARSSSLGRTGNPTKKTRREQSITYGQ
ncbi:hypothetical protein CORC01_09239 [Colletotrichum orchidophilum]|uniref:Uncharacterized protein n=1 Tax=Colletotrichum orchidophilum TaxID=1209926 RepID=A0A1G4B2C6_9PEZI|nr:uncharacterized protein CORC01_09239 [Colletotrichum orchidophilum]OHE95506.1 hypothetical protein CORC01_09239 [Colletotrichum orchidophilum]